LLTKLIQIEDWKLRTEGRYHYQENIQFCRQSRGSLEESLDHLITAFDEEYINLDQLTQMRSQYELCLRLLNGYISYLMKRKQNG